MSIDSNQNSSLQSSILLSLLSNTIKHSQGRLKQSKPAASKTLLLTHSHWTGVWKHAHTHILKWKGCKNTEQQSDQIADMTDMKNNEAKHTQLVGCRIHLCDYRASVHNNPMHFQGEQACSCWFRVSQTEQLNSKPRLQRHAEENESVCVCARRGDTYLRFSTLQQKAKTAKGRPLWVMSE